MENANGLGNGNGNAASAGPATSNSSGHSHKSGSTGNPHTSGSTGDPHTSGSTGSPHTSGSAGNPHTGSPPYGVATGVSNRGGGSAGGGSNGNNGQDKTTICHATGSATNPYVEITIANPAVQAHARHQDGRDIIPAPPGGCPGVAAIGAPGASGAPGNAAIGVKAASAGGAAAGETSRVMGAVTGGDAPAGGPAADAAVSPKASGTLPFTGLAVAVLGSIGAVLLFGGWLVRALGLRRTSP